MILSGSYVIGQKMNSNLQSSKTGERRCVLEEQLLEEFAKQLLADAEEKREDGISLGREVALAEVVLTYLEEAGHLSEHEFCPYEDLSGRNRCKVIGYALPEDSNRLDLFTAKFVQAGEPQALTVDEIQRLAGRAARFFGYAASKDFAHFGESKSAVDAARYIATELDRIEDVRVFIFTNGLAKARDVESVEIQGRAIEFSIMDLERLFRASRSAVTRELIEVDFEKLLKRPLGCLEMKPKPSEYETYLALLPGEVIYTLYEEFGPRLFEFNVRSFLQAKGKVNKGLRETLKTQPSRFLAFNNGITATADEIEVVSYMGETAIKRVKGLQIVNGAQTASSIHRAKKADRLDISGVAVSVKLTRVASEKLAEFVPLIAQYANTQNVVQISDLSANNEFHIKMEQLSEQFWCPGEEQRWFYERARGSYQVAVSRHGTTQAKRREFERSCPKGNKFSKTDLAKFLMSWWQRPQVVSKGAQKNFSIFMADLPETFPVGWVPDEDFYKEAVSLAILFRAAQSTVRSLKLQSYGANVITYMIAKLSHDYGDRFDLGMLWMEQEVSDELRQLLGEWAPHIHACIVESAGKSNVTEWCKKEQCWDAIKALSLDEPAQGIPELAEPAEDTPRIEDPPTLAQIDPVDICCRIGRSGWAQVVAWAASTDKVSDFDQRVANTLAGYALDHWRRRPSAKQAEIGLRVLQRAEEGGIVNLSDL